MKERPILFSGPMVRALLDGRKTQTRRVIKPQPEHGLHPCGWVSSGWALASAPTDVCPIHGCTCDEVKCPFGIPGDRLYVRETWAQGISYTPSLRRIAYRATEPDLDATWKPSIHMPRAASRISLEITEVRVERLQAITPADAEAEGITVEQAARFIFNQVDIAPLVQKYRELWNGLNATRGYGWDANPWVWALTFTVVTP